MMKLGEIQNLKIDKKVEFGVYLTDGEEKVLLPKKQVPENASIGDELSVFVYKDSKDRLIATTNEPLITMGEIKKLKVKNVTQIGAFMDWGLEKDILLPFKEQTAKVTEGKEYLVRMYSDKSDRLCVSMKLYESLLPIEGYKEGDSFTGTVYEYKKEMGAFVAIDDKYSGLIHENELFNKAFVGDTVSGRIKKIRDDGKADLMIREPAYIQMNEDAEMVYDIIKSYQGVLPFTDKADKEVIKKEFGLSKNAFKRAVGRLLKEGRIEITDSTINILK